MRIAVFGSTGGNGRLVLGEAIRRGHTVTAFARRGHTLDEVAGLCAGVEGDATDRAAVEKAIAGQDAVIVTVRSPGPERILARVARTVTAAMESHGVSRLVATSAYGMVATHPYVLASIVRRFFAREYADQSAADLVIESSDLEWTIARATRLISGPVKGPGRLNTELFTEGPYSLPRSLYAARLVDLAESHEYARQIVNVSA